MKSAQNYGYYTSDWKCPDGIAIQIGLLLTVKVHTFATAGTYLLRHNMASGAIQSANRCQNHILRSHICCTRGTNEAIYIVTFVWFIF